jgi:hypothetical protein
MVKMIFTSYTDLHELLGVVTTTEQIRLLYFILIHLNNYVSFSEMAKITYEKESISEPGPVPAYFEERGGIQRTTWKQTQD